MCDSGSYLHVHHKDESRKHGTSNMNNNLDNLITLCFGCHLKIHRKRATSTDQKEKILECYRLGYSYGEIVNSVGVGKGTVYLTLKKARKNDPTLDEDASEAVRLNWKHDEEDMISTKDLRRLEK